MRQKSFAPVQRICSLLLAVILLAGMVPYQVFAEEPVFQQPAAEEVAPEEAPAEVEVETPEEPAEEIEEIFEETPVETEEIEEVEEQEPPVEEPQETPAPTPTPAPETPVQVTLTYLDFCDLLGLRGEDVPFTLTHEGSPVACSFTAVEDTDPDTELTTVTYTGRLAAGETADSLTLTPMEGYQQPESLSLPLTLTEGTLTAHAELALERYTLTGTVDNTPVPEAAFPTLTLTPVEDLSALLEDYRQEVAEQVEAAMEQLEEDSDLTPEYTAQWLWDVDALTRWLAEKALTVTPSDSGWDFEIVLPAAARVELGWQLGETEHRETRLVPLTYTAALTPNAPEDVELEGELPDPIEGDAEELRLGYLPLEEDVLPAYQALGDTLDLTPSVTVQWKGEGPRKTDPDFGTYTLTLTKKNGEKATFPITKEDGYTLDIGSNAPILKASFTQEGTDPKYTVKLDLNVLNDGGYLSDYSKAELKPSASPTVEQYDPVGAPVDGVYWFKRTDRAENFDKTQEVHISFLGDDLAPNLNHGGDLGLLTLEATLTHGEGESAETKKFRIVETLDEKGNRVRSLYVEGVADPIATLNTEIRETVSGPDAQNVYALPLTLPSTVVYEGTHYTLKNEGSWAVTAAEAPKNYIVKTHGDNTVTYQVKKGYRYEEEAQTTAPLRVKWQDELPIDHGDYGTFTLTRTLKRDGEEPRSEQVELVWHEGSYKVKNQDGSLSDLTYTDPVTGEKINAVLEFDARDKRNTTVTVSGLSNTYFEDGKKYTADWKLELTQPPLPTEEQEYLLLYEDDAAGQPHRTYLTPVKHLNFTVDMNGGDTYTDPAQYLAQGGKIEINVTYGNSRKPIGQLIYKDGAYTVDLYKGQDGDSRFAGVGVVVTEKDSTGHEWNLQLTDLPAFAQDDQELVYSLTASTVSLQDGTGDSLKPVYTNATLMAKYDGEGDRDTTPKGTYSNGKLALNLSGTTTFSTTKHWYQDEGTKLPTTTYTLWRYSPTGAGGTKNDYTTASVVFMKQGEDTHQSAMILTSQYSGKTADDEHMEELLSISSLPKYDPQGYPYTYMLYENMAETIREGETEIPNDYVMKFGTLDEKGNLITVADRNQRHEHDKFIYNHEPVTNVREDVIEKGAHKSWQNGDLQSAIDDVVVVLGLESKPKNSTGDWTKTNRYYRNYSPFYSESQSRDYYTGETLPQYDALGRELEYRWYEAGVFQGTGLFNDGKPTATDLMTKTDENGNLVYNNLLSETEKTDASGSYKEFSLNIDGSQVAYKSSYHVNQETNTSTVWNVVEAWTEHKVTKTWVNCPGHPDSVEIRLHQVDFEGNDRIFGTHDSDEAWDAEGQAISCVVSKDKTDCVYTVPAAGLTESEFPKALDKEGNPFPCDGYLHLFHLPRYDSVGRAYRYYAEELPLTGYHTTYNFKDRQTDITNTQGDKPTYLIRLKKFWLDGSDNKNRQPTHMEVFTKGVDGTYLSLNPNHKYSTDSTDKDDFVLTEGKNWMLYEEHGYPDEHWKAPNCTEEHTCWEHFLDKSKGEALPGTENGVEWNTLYSRFYGTANGGAEGSNLYVRETALGATAQYKVIGKDEPFPYGDSDHADPSIRSSVGYSTVTTNRNEYEVIYAGDYAKETTSREQTFGTVMVNGTPYERVQDALTDAAAATNSANKIVSLIRDMNETLTIDIGNGNSVILNLNDHNIKGGIHVKSGQVELVPYGTMKAGDVTNATGAALEVDEGATVHVYGGHFQSSSGSALVNKGTVTVDTMNGDTVFRATNAVTVENSGSLTVYNSLLSGSKSVLNNSGTLTIYGGRLEGLSGGAENPLLINSGTATLNGGTYTAVTLFDTKENSTLSINSGNYTDMRSLLTADSAGTVNVTGGKFEIVDKGDIPLVGKTAEYLSKLTAPTITPTTKPNQPAPLTYDVDTYGAQGTDGYNSVYNRRIGQVKLNIDTTWADGVPVNYDGVHSTTDAAYKKFLQVVMNRNDANFGYRLTQSSKNNTLKTFLLSDYLDFSNRELLQPYNGVAASRYLMGNAITLPKYDYKGEVIGYQLGEASSNYRDYSYIRDNGTDRNYEVGKRRITDTLTYTFRYRLTGTKQVTFYKQWLDDSQFEMGNRPDLYLKIYRFVYDNYDASTGGYPHYLRDEDGKIIGTETDPKLIYDNPETGIHGHLELFYSNCRWEKRKENEQYSTDGTDDYNWSCTFTNLPRYDIYGREISYYAVEGLAGSYAANDYVILQSLYPKTEEPVLGREAEPSNRTEMEAATPDKLINDLPVVLDMDGEGNNDALLEGGTFRNSLDNIADIAGKKVWANLPGGFDPKDFPSLQFVLYRYLKNDKQNRQPVAFTQVFTADQQKLSFDFEFKYMGENHVVGGEVKHTGGVGLKLDEATTVANPIEAKQLPKYDESGRIYEYEVEELILPNPAVKDSEAENAVNVIDAVGNQGNTYTITNSFNKQLTNGGKDSLMNSADLTVSKVWQTPGWVKGDKRPTVRLRLYQTYKTAEGYAQPYLVDTRITKNSDYENIEDTTFTVSFEDLPVLAPNLSRYVYLLVEDHIDGYFGSFAALTPAGKDVPDVPAVGKTWAAWLREKEPSVHAEDIIGDAFSLEMGTPEKNTYTVDCTNKNPAQVAIDPALTGTKIWDDFSNKLGTRPDSITLTLSRRANGNEELNTAAIARQNVAEITLNWDKTADTITPTLTVKKNPDTNEDYPDLWMDGEDGEDKHGITAALENDSWTYWVTGLYKYAPNGSEWIYEVREETVPEHYALVWNTTRGTNQFEHKNKLERTYVSAQKQWQRLGNLERPEVEYALQVSTDGGENWQWAKDVLSAVNSNFSLSSKTVGDNPRWENLPKYKLVDNEIKELTYRIREISVEGISILYNNVGTEGTDTPKPYAECAATAVEQSEKTKQNENLHYQIDYGTTEKDGKTVNTITNTLLPPYARVTITKKFELDSDNAFLTRLGGENWYVRFKLKQQTVNGEESPVKAANGTDLTLEFRWDSVKKEVYTNTPGCSVELENGVYTLVYSADLPAKDKAGNVIQYQAVELADVRNNAASAQNLYAGCYGVTEVLAQGSVVNGVQKPYTVEHITEEVEGGAPLEYDLWRYTTNVTNTFKPLNVTVVKTWEGDEEGFRPTRLPLKLLRNGVDITEIYENYLTSQHKVDLDWNLKATTDPNRTYGWQQVDGNRWSFTFYNLPKQDENKVPYRYTVEEDPQPGYGLPRYTVGTVESMDAIDRQRIEVTNTAYSFKLDKVDTVTGKSICGAPTPAPSQPEPQLHGASPRAAGDPVSLDYPNNNYTSLNALIVANPNVSIRLRSDVKETVTIPNGAAVTLDLNGFSITNNTAADTITVALGGSLTLNDSMGTGRVDNVTHNKTALLNNGTTVMNGGTLDRSQNTGKTDGNPPQNTYYTLVNHGEMTINGGSVHVGGTKSDGASLIENGYSNYGGSSARNSYKAGVNQEQPTLTINNGSFAGGLATVKNDDGGKLTIKGGSYYNNTNVLFYNYGREMTITGGEFTTGGNVGTLLLTQTYTENEYNNAVLNISGGTFKTERPTAVVINDDGLTKDSITITGGDFYTNTLTNKADSGFIEVKENVKPSQTGEELYSINPAVTLNLTGKDATADYTAEWSRDKDGNELIKVKKGNKIVYTAYKAGGAVDIKGLPAGEYDLTETVFPDGYEKTTDLGTLTLTATASGVSLTASATTVNTVEGTTLKVGNVPVQVKFAKVDPNGAYVAGATFALSGSFSEQRGAAPEGASLSEDRGTLTWTTTTQPQLLTGWLKVGENYTLTETQNPDGYEVSDSGDQPTRTFHVDETGILVWGTPDDLSNAAAQAVQVKSDTNIAGQTPEIQVTNQPIVLTLTKAMAEGTLHSDTVFTLTDTTANPDVSADITVSVSGSITLNLNTLNGKAVKLITGHSYTLTEKTAPAGAIQSGNLTAKFTIDNKGNIGDLVSTPTNDGKVEQNGNTEIKFTNNPTKLTLNKVSSEDDTKELSGYSFTLTGKFADGSESQTITDTQNNPLTNLLVRGETYTLTEVTAPNGYELAADVKFTVENDGNITITTTATTKEGAHQTVAASVFANNTVTLTVQDDPIIVNLLKKGKDGAEVSQTAAAFTVTPATGETFADGKTTQITTTAANFATDTKAQLIPGKTYTVTETTAPEGYELTQFSFTVNQQGVATVTTDPASPYSGSAAATTEGNTVTLTVTDTPISLTLTKTKTDTATALQGAIFMVKGVFADKAEEQTFYLNTGTAVEKNRTFKDKSGTEQTVTVYPMSYLDGKWLVGKTYTLTEELAPDGYKRSDVSTTFTVKKDGTIDTVYGAPLSGIDTDKLTFTDDPIELTLTKTVTGTNSKLYSDTIFKLTDTSADPYTSATITVPLNKNGSTSTFTLEPGKMGDGNVQLINGHTYTLSETIAPAGAIQPGGAENALSITFTLNQNGDGTLTVNSTTSAVGGSVEATDDSTGIKFTNTPTSLSLVKKSSKGDTTPTGYSFTLTGVFADGTNQATKTITATENNPITGLLVRGETYTLKETTAPNGYELAADVKIKVQNDGSIRFMEPGETETEVEKENTTTATTKDTNNPVASYSFNTANNTVTLTVRDDPIRVKLEKYGLNNKEQPTAQFTVTGIFGNDTKETTITTTAEDFLTKTEAKLVQNRTYKVTETKAVDGYELTQFSFTVKTDGTVEKVTNPAHPYTGSVEFINGTDADANAVILKVTDDTIGIDLTKTFTGNADRTESGLGSYAIFTVSGDFADGQAGTTTYYLSNGVAENETEAFNEHTVHPFSHMKEKWKVTEDGKESEQGAVVYTITEVKAPDGYEIRQGSATFTVNPHGFVKVKDAGTGNFLTATDKSSTLKFSDEPIELTLTKEITDGKLYSDTTFKLTDTTDGNFETITVDGNKEASNSITLNPSTLKTVKLVNGHTYTLSETTAPAGAIQPGGEADALSIRFTLNDNGNGTLTVNNKTTPEGGSVEAVSSTAIKFTNQPTSLTLTKVSSEEDAVLSGDYKFTLSGKFADNMNNANASKTLTNTQNTLTGLLVREETYTLHEVTAPNGYELAADVTFKVENDGSIRFQTKKDNVYSPVDGNVQESGNSAEQTKVGSHPVASYSFSANAVTLTVRDDPIIVKLTKQNSGDTALTGAVFKVEGTFAKNTTGKIEGVTVENIANTLKAELIPGKTYTVTETTAPAGYELTAFSFKVNVNGEVTIVSSQTSGSGTAISDGNETITVTDTPIRLTLSKTENGKTTPLDGAIFKVRGTFKDGETDYYVHTGTTAAAERTYNAPNGQSVKNSVHPMSDLTGKWLVDQTYTLTEELAPEGYKRSDVSTTFTVEKDGTIATATGTPLSGIGTDKLTFTDDPIVLTLTKEITSGGKLYSDTTFKLVDNAVSGKSETITVGKIDGNTNSVTLKLLGTVPLISGHTYTLSETTAPNGAIQPGGAADALSITFKLNSNGDGTLTAVNPTSAEGGSVEAVSSTAIKFTNQPTKLTLKKVSSEGDTMALSGYSFTLSGTFADNSASKTLTDGDASTLTGLLVRGETYILKEITAPNGYELAADVTFKVENDGNITINSNATTKEGSHQAVAISQFTDNAVSLTVRDDPIIVKLTKQNIGDTALTGAVFKVEGTFAKNTTGKIEGVTVESIANTLKAELIPGVTYTVTETTAPKGYEVTQFSFTVKPDGTIDTATHDKDYSGGVAKSGDTLTVTDDPIQLRLFKTDSDDKTKSIESETSDHAVFQLTSGTLADDTPANQYLCNAPSYTAYTGQTLETFESMDGKWLPGEVYTLQEVYAPKGYKLDTTSVTFQFDTQGKLSITSGGSDNPAFIQTTGITGAEVMGFINQPIQMAVLKVSGMEGSQKLQGATFTLQEQGNVESPVATVTTGTEGTITLKRVEGGLTLTYGKTYVLTEETAPNGYILPVGTDNNPLTVTFTIQPNGSIETVTSNPAGVAALTGGTVPTIQVTNQPTKLTLTKASTEGEFNIPDGGKGYQYTIEGTFANPENQQKVTTPITVDKGNLNLTAQLICGETYTITETQAPTGYKLDKTVYTFTVNENGTITDPTVMPAAPAQQSEEESPEENEEITPAAEEAPEPPVNPLLPTYSAGTLTLKDEPLKIAMVKKGEDKSTGEYTVDQQTAAQFTVKKGETEIATVTAADFGTLASLLDCGETYTVTETGIPEGYEAVSFTLKLDDVGNYTVTHGSGVFATTLDNVDGFTIHAKDALTEITLTKTVLSNVTGEVSAANPIIFTISGPAGAFTETENTFDGTDSSITRSIVTKDETSTYECKFTDKNHLTAPVPKGLLKVNTVYTLTETAPKGLAGVDAFRFRLNDSGEIELVDDKGEVLKTVTNVAVGGTKKDTLTITNGQATPEIKGATLFIDERIGINFYVDFGGVPSGEGDNRVPANINYGEAGRYFVRLYAMDSNGQYIKDGEKLWTKDIYFDQNAYNFLTSGSTVYPLFRFTCWNYPYNMADYLVASLCYRKDNGTVERISTQGLKYSVARYAEAMLAQAGATGDTATVFGEENLQPELKAMLVDMMNYGTAAQRYGKTREWGSDTPWNESDIGRRTPDYVFGGQKDTIWKEKITDLSAASLSSHALAVSGTGESTQSVAEVLKAAGITFKGISLGLEEGASVSMSFHFEVESPEKTESGETTTGGAELDHSNITMTLTAGGGNYEVMPRDQKWEWGNHVHHGPYAFTVKGIPAYNWDDTFTLNFEVKKGDNTYDVSIEYSVLTYIYNQLSAGAGDTADLLKAMYRYSLTTSNYIKNVTGKEYEVEHKWSYKDTGTDYGHESENKPKTTTTEVPKNEQENP